MSSYSEKNDQSSPMTQNIALLNEVSLFSTIPAQALKIIALLCRRNVLEAGEKLFEKGDDPSQCVYIISGKFSLIAERDDKSLDTVDKEYGKGELLGTLSLLASTPSLFSMIAQEESEVLILDRKSFNKVVEQFPEIYKFTVINIIKNIQRYDVQQLNGTSSELTSHVGVSLI